VERELTVHAGGERCRKENRVGIEIGVELIVEISFAAHRQWAQNPKVPAATQRRTPRRRDAKSSNAPHSATLSRTANA